MHHEDFEHEIQLSLVDTAEVEQDRNTLQDTWDTHKYVQSGHAGCGDATPPPGRW